MGNAFSILLVAAAIVAVYLSIGPIHWAWWQFRRTVWRHKQFSLGSLFVYFTIVAILVGMTAAYIRGAG